MPETAIYTQQLGKSYDGSVYALHDLTLEVPQGEVFGFLGPNGAGKTTTVKLLTGLLKPTEGSCAVMGLSPAKKACEVHRLCGAVMESARMYGQMTGMENLLFFAQTAEMDSNDSRTRAEELLKKLDLWDARDKKLKTYSTGMAQRLSFARALIHRPRVLFLDEPTSGLDPESAQSVNAMVFSLAKSEGATVFLCTHQLRYAQDICSRYAILHKGQLLACGDLETLSKNAGIYSRAALRLKDGDTPDGFARDDDGWCRTDIMREDEMPKLLKSLITSGHDVYEAKIERPELENVYFKYLRIEEEAVCP